MKHNNDKFSVALKWIDEHKEEFDGQFVVLDGDKLIAHGKDSKTVYDDARAKGYQSPFLKRVKAKVLPFGGWWVAGHFEFDLVYEYSFFKTGISVETTLQNDDLSVDADAKIDTGSTNGEVLTNCPIRRR